MSYADRMEVDCPRCLGIGFDPFTPGRPVCTRCNGDCVSIETRSEEFFRSTLAIIGKTPKPGGPFYGVGEPGVFGEFGDPPEDWDDE